MAEGSTRYDRLGTSYSLNRRPDPSIAAQIRRALGGARRIVNVGAGTGSYEPAGIGVLAVEPSLTMIAQRPPGSAPAVCGRAEELPFGDRAFDVAMAVLTLHHWQDKAKGLSELRRVAKRTLVLTFDPSIEHSFWLVRDYLPEIGKLDWGPMPGPEQVAEATGARCIQVVPIRHDCADGFLCAYWRRPAAYLDPTVQSCISGIALLDAEVVKRGISRLASDLETGHWLDRHGELLTRTDMDWGYRLVFEAETSSSRGRSPSGCSAGTLPVQL